MDVSRKAPVEHWKNAVDKAKFGFSLTKNTKTVPR
jgi:hypothetical protein